MHRYLSWLSKQNASILFLNILILFLLQSCGVIPWFGKDQDPTPPTKLTDFTPKLSTKILWSQRPTRGTVGKRLVLIPALITEKVYVADAQGKLSVLAADTGHLIWERETGIALNTGPAHDADRLIFGTNHGEIVAFSLTDGHELWRTSLESEILSLPCFTGDGKLIVHTLEDAIYSLDPTNGKIFWKVTYSAPILTLRGSSSPILIPGGVLVGLSGGKLVKLELATGSPLWETVITRPSGRSELARITDIDADPVLFNGTIYVGSYNGDLAAVNPETGEVLWRRELSAYAGLSVDSNGLYITDAQDRVLGADLTSGAGLWKQEQLLYRQLTAPVLFEQQIVVGDYEGYLHFIDQKDGALTGKVRITSKAAITARPLIDNKKLLIYADDGTVSALTVSNH